MSFRLIKRMGIVSLLVILMCSTISAQSSVTKQIKSLNAKISKQDAKIKSLETEIQILLPDLKNALQATLAAKQQTDSVAIMLINRINTLQNKIRLLEDKAAYSDSTNFQILSQLVMIENKIITMANSFTEMYSLKNESVEGSPSISSFTSTTYKKQYIEALSHYQNGDYTTAIKGFSELVLGSPNNPLADNSQYWLAECYYTQKNYKRAIIELEKVFTYPGTDKNDDAQLKLGHAYLSMGNIDKAREEYKRLLEYFPGSEFYPKAKDAIRQLSVN